MYKCDVFYFFKEKYKMIKFISYPKTTSNFFYFNFFHILLDKYYLMLALFIKLKKNIYQTSRLIDTNDATLCIKLKCYTNETNCFVIVM